MRPALFAAIPLFASGLLAQSNAIPGTDLRVYDVGSPTVYGRRGPAYPQGEAGVGFGHSYCNSGTVPLTWLGWVGGSSSQAMLDTYPKIAFLLARESGGRMVQVSGESFLKHSRVPYNFSSGPCAPCQTGPSNTMRVGCSDTYSTGFNGDRYNLGPTTEINPWLGSWNSVGSYFDVGDPAVSGAAAADGIQSLTSQQVFAFDAVKNRLVVRETELATAGTFYGQVHLMVKGEPVANRDNNLMSRGLSFTWNGSSWSTTFSGAANLQGSVLSRWTGATTAMAGNGPDDGRFLVAVKVTGPVEGMWHYEYAVHNIDNDRGGASLRIPVCPTARAINFGFRDVDGDALNEWTVSRTANEIAFLASATNALDWNCIYNFWFDSDAAPVAGSVSIDEARLGAGSLSVAVASQTPTLLGTEYLGDGCGTPAPRAWSNGLPTSPNAAFAVQFKAAPSAFLIGAFGLGGANVDLGSGCTFFLDEPQMVLLTLVQANAAGIAEYPLPLAAGMSPIDYFAQGFEIVDGGPFLGFLAPTNGLKIRVAGAGCP
ncbi:MAG: hypothetical protein JNK78_10800 [Planctomycetes bacterium]|nr:hypothetical protein [Planctomycetota bacterium]